MKKRVVWVEQLRIAAMLSVVMLHVLSKGISTIEMHSMEWEIYNAGRCLVKWGVPVFVMISGIFLLEKKETTVVELKQKIGHILSALIFWLCIYAGNSILNNYLRGNIIDKMVYLNAVEILCFGYTHLWYLYMLLGLYLVLPFVRKLTDKHLMEYYIALFLLFNIGLNVIQNIPTDITADLARFINLFQIKSVAGFSGYLLIGYYLYHYDIHKYLKRGIYIWGTIAFPLSMYLTHKQDGNYFFTDGNFSVVNFSTAIFFFLLFKEKVSNISCSERQLKIISELSALSFGIYLIHVGVLGYVNDYIISLRLGSFWNIVIISALTLGISIVLCKMLQKIPLVRKFI